MDKVTESKLSSNLPVTSESNLNSPVTQPAEAVPAQPETPVTTSPLPNHRNKKLLIVTALVLAVVVVGSAIAGLVLRSNSNVPAEAISEASLPTTFQMQARAQYVLGDVWKEVEGRRVSVLEGDILAEGDKVEVGSESRLVLSFDDGSVVRLGEDSVITLSTLGTSLMQFSQDSGVLFARVQKDESHKFIVDTGGVVVESLGTAFSVEKQDEVKVSVFESSVKVKKATTELMVEADQQWQEGEDKVQGLDTDKLATNDFLSWSLEEEKLAKAKQLANPTDKPKENTVSNGLVLTGESLSDGLRLNWSAEGIDVSKGFKLVKNTAGSPKYPGDAAVFVESNARTYKWQVKDGNTWHVRICQYTGSACGVYSNEIVLTASSGTSDKSSVKSIQASGKFEGGVAIISWSVEGNSPKGYKVVWSEKAGPTYPLRDGDQFKYLNNSEARAAEVGGLSAGKNYHFRVCEYLGGKCGVYSNEFTLSY